MDKNHEWAVKDYLIKKGINPSLATVEQYKEARKAIRSTWEYVRDAGAATVSFTVTTTGLRRLKLPVIQQRARICPQNKCGSFGLLEGSIPVCHRCNCIGKFLEAKQADPAQTCPAGLWPEVGEEDEEQ